MSNIELRTITPDEMVTFRQATGRAFGFTPTPPAEGEDPAWLASFEYDRSIAALDEGLIVATANAFSFEMTVPGGFLPVAGVSWVGVQPTHRRRGVLTSIMRRQLDDVRDRGEPLAALWASESIIYGRFGYGLATVDESYEIERAHSKYARPHEPQGSISYVTFEEAQELFPPVWEKVRPHRAGMMTRSAPFWKRSWDEKDWNRVLYRRNGEAEGYIIYKPEGEWADGLPRGSTNVLAFLAVSEEAHADLWRFCLDIDLVNTIRAEHRPVDDPLPWLLADPRRLKRLTRDALWLRMIDIPKALGGRRYQGEGRIVFDVHDSFCPWNQGRYELEVDGAVNCGPTRATPQLSLSAVDLAAIYLGGVKSTTLAAAGRIEEHDDGALALTDRLFATSPEPWCPMLF
jgi:predicted acetyltransferase